MAHLKEQNGFAAHGFDHLEAERRHLAAVDRGPAAWVETPWGRKKLVRIGTSQLTPQQERIAERRRDQRDGVAAQEDEDGQLSGATETDAAATATAAAAVIGATGPVSGSTAG